MTDALAETRAILRDLIGFPTISADSNLELIAYANARLDAIGVRTHLTLSPAGDKANLFATVGPGRRWRGRAVGPHGRRPRRGAGLVGRSLSGGGAGRPHLRPRRLRHEGLHRLRAGAGAALRRGRARTPAPSSADIRRRGRLPRRPRPARRFGRARPPPVALHRRRADGDAHHRGPQGLSRVHDPFHRPRRPRLAPGGRRQRRRIRRALCPRAAGDGRGPARPRPPPAAASSRPGRPSPPAPSVAASPTT